MSRAIICDRCGKIYPEPSILDEQDWRTMWTRTNPNHLSKDSQFSNADIHLCGDCYAQFEREYLANVRGEGAS